MSFQDNTNFAKEKQELFCNVVCVCLKEKHFARYKKKTFSQIQAKKKHFIILFIIIVCRTTFLYNCRV